MARISFLLFLFLLLSGTKGFDPSTYPNFQVLDPNYIIYWRINEGKERIELGLEVKTEGWIGFGLAESTSGSMPGADILVVSFPSGKAKVGDYFTTDFVRPTEDTCQDWKLTSSKQEEGVSFVEVYRSLDTKDSQDRPFSSGRLKVVFAYGTSSQSELQYHQTRRGMDEITFWSKEGEEEGKRVPGPEEKKAEFKFNNYVIPPQKTVYACQSIPIPLNEGEVDHHVVQIDPIIDPLNLDLAHHIIVHLCTNDSASSYPNTYQDPQECNSPVGNPVSGCQGILYTWASGVGSMNLPEKAGFRMGHSKEGFKFMVIEMHYNNPNLISGRTDSTGFRIHYTPKLREFDAGTMTLGDPVLALPSIPPGKKEVKYETNCPSECTSKFSHPITVFGSFLHMHQIGSKMRTSHFRPGEGGEKEFLGFTNRVDFYSFDMQQQTRVSFTVNPGDILNTHCIYDSSFRTEETPFFLGSDEEMCMDFLVYYPKLYVPKEGEEEKEDFSLCGYFGEATICGSVKGVGTGETFLNLPNPSFQDPVPANNGSFGVVPEACSTIKGNSLAIPVGVGVGVSAAVVLLLVLVLGLVFFLKKRKS